MSEIFNAISIKELAKTPRVTLYEKDYFSRLLNECINEIRRKSPDFKINTVAPYKEAFLNDFICGIKNNSDICIYPVYTLDGRDYISCLSCCEAFVPYAKEICKKICSIIDTDIKLTFMTVNKIYTVIKENINGIQYEMIELPDFSGEDKSINVFFNSEFLNKIFSRLSLKNQLIMELSDKKNQIVQEINKDDIRMCCVLGEAELSIKELYLLKTGKIIKLKNKNVGEDFDLYLNKVRVGKCFINSDKNENFFLEISSVTKNNSPRQFVDKVTKNVINNISNMEYNRYSSLFLPEFSINEMNEELEKNNEDNISAVEKSVNNIKIPLYAVLFHKHISMEEARNYKTGSKIPFNWETEKGDLVSLYALDSILAYGELGVVKSETGESLGFKITNFV